MALGATRSPELARRVGRALGREVRALGITVNFAPVCDVNSNPANPVVGTRSFGEDPALVGELAAAMIAGIQDAGVAAVAKHFPGHGDTADDSHHGVPLVTHARDRVEQTALPPFARAIDAGVAMVMAAHVAVPALDEGRVRPATLSRPVLHGLLREQLRFGGVIISDAMDMKAIRQGEGLAGDTREAVAAGIDLLIFNLSAAERRTAVRGLQDAIAAGRLSRDAIRASVDRIAALKATLARVQPPGLDVIGCSDHLALARDVASRAITLVRDTAGLLPLRLPPRAQIVTIVPQPRDLTPADTSSYVEASLTDAVRLRHAAVTEVRIPLDLAAADIDAVLESAAHADLVIAGTINAAAFPGQAALVDALVRRRLPTVAVALRLPYDLASYPAAPTSVCSYGVLRPSLDAVVRALWGDAPFTGRLPVSIPGLYASGHGIVGGSAIT
jgi:beta-N-acetylhexosaminidase